MIKATTSLFLTFLITTVLAGCGNGGSSPSAPIDEGPQTIFDDPSYDLDLPSETIYGVTILGFNGTGSIATGVSEDGVVGGHFYLGPGRAAAYQWDAGVLTVVSDYALSKRVSGDGSIAGWLLDRESGYTYVDGVFTEVNANGATDIYDVNSFGEAVGVRRVDDVSNPVYFDGHTTYGIVDGFKGAAFLINDNGDIVLHQDHDDGRVTPVLMVGDELIPLASYEGQFTMSNDMNIHGDVVGWSQMTPQNTRAMLWTGGLAFDVTPVGQNSCSANGINDYGDVVIRCSGVGGYTGYLLKDNILTELQFDGVDGIFPSNINNAGQIAGNLTIYEPERQIRSFLATPR